MVLLFLLSLQSGLSVKSASLEEQAKSRDERKQFTAAPCPFPIASCEVNFFSLSRLYMILAMPSFVLLSNMQNIHFLLPLERKRSSTWLSVDTLLLPEGEHDSLIFPVGSSYTRLWLGV